MAARHPGRVGAGFATGYQQRDFDIVGADFADRSPAFWRQLGFVVQALSGRASGALADDPAVSALERPTRPGRRRDRRTGRRPASRGPWGRNPGDLAARRRRRPTTRRRVPRCGRSGPRRADPAGLGRRRRSHASTSNSGTTATPASSRRGWSDRWTTRSTPGGPDDGRRTSGGDLRAVGADSLNIRVHTAGMGPDRDRRSDRPLRRGGADHLRSAATVSQVTLGHAWRHGPGGAGRRGDPGEQRRQGLQGSDDESEECLGHGGNRQNLVRRSDGQRLAGVEGEHRGAVPAHEGHVVVDQQDRRAGLRRACRSSPRSGPVHRSWCPRWARRAAPADLPRR